MRKLQNVGMFVLVYTTLFSSLCMASSLKVSWNAVAAADLDGYKVYYGNQSGVYSTITTVRNASSCLISNVQNGSTYYIAVSSFDKSGNESSRSAEVSAYIPVTETDTTPPAESVDTTPPTGSLLINASASTTTSATVTLSLYFSDANGTVTAMKFSNDGINYTSETSVAPSIIWTLSDGYGLKTVYVLFKDAAGNWMSTPATASINLVSPGTPTSTVVVPSVDPSTSTPEGTAQVPDDVSGGQGSLVDVANIKPIITSPDNNQEEVPLRPTLKTDPHAQDYSVVQWEISNDAGEALLDLKTARYRTELVVPDMVLSAGMKHYCRVRYIDGSGNTSDWSDPVAFQTVAYDPQDMNLNGIPDDQELIAGEDIDLDMNGVYDRTQSDMKALLTEIGGEYVSLKISTNCRAITSFKSIDPATIVDTEGKPHDLPIGLIDFKAEVDNPGDFADVVVHLSEPAPFGAKWYMYDEALGWRVYPHVAFSDDRMRVTVRLKDGDRTYGDADGVANGIIIDPSGLGMGEDSDNGLCFISASDSQYSPINLGASMLLVLVVFVMTVTRSRPRGRQ